MLVLYPCGHPDTRLDILPAPQRRLWPELSAVPAHFVIYGGTALTLRLGHRVSPDFYFFSNESFDPDRLAPRFAFQFDRADMGVHMASLLDNHWARKRQCPEASLGEGLSRHRRHCCGMTSICQPCRSSTVYGGACDAIITLKALSYFDGVSDLPVEVTDQMIRCGRPDRSNKAANAATVSQTPR